jgi:hypothetical protein
MKQYVLLSVDFKKDLGQVRRRKFANQLKELNWNRDIPSAAVWWKRFDKNPGEQARKDVRQATGEVDIEQCNAMYQVTSKKPQEF